jgi:hypothetical protein
VKEKAVGNRIGLGATVAGYTFTSVVLSFDSVALNWTTSVTPVAASTSTTTTDSESALQPAIIRARASGTQ